ncbi:MAG TPA: winged helix-turn-helix domain-containing protein [Gammaproteobacteria bacterium]
MYEFGGYRLDPVRRVLSRLDGTRVPLKPKAFDTLLCLLEHRGALVTKEHLLEAVWPNVVVEENTLNKNISMVRHVLGESRADHRFIVTEPGRGYRFVAKVTEVLGDSPSAETVADDPPPFDDEDPAGQAPARRDEAGSSAGGVRQPVASRARPWRIALGLSVVAVVVFVAVVVAHGLVVDPKPAVLPSSVAVMPFTNLSPNEEDEYFALGMHQEVINQLAKIGDVTVVSRSTMMQYGGGTKSPREIAAEQNVAAVLEASVRRAAERIRFAVQLVDAETDMLLWSETYDAAADVENLFAMQTSIATNVAEALRARLSQRERTRLARVPTRSSAAYGHYLAALAADHSSSGDASARAIDELRKAVALDPGFALARAKLAYVLAVAPTWRPDRTAEYQDEALDAGRRGLELEPDLPEAHHALAVVHLVRGEWSDVDEAYRRALELGATRAEMAEIGNFELAVGYIEQARATFDSNQGANPLNSTGLAFYLAASEIVGDRAAVREAYEQGSAFVSGWPFGEYLMNYVRLGRGETRALTDDRGAPPHFKAELGRMGSDAEGLAALRDWYAQLENPTHNEHTVTAAWAAHFGDVELALRAARGATQTRRHNVWFLWLPLFDDVRRSPEFAELVADLGLVEYWRRNGWPRFCRPTSGGGVECS